MYLFYYSLNYYTYEMDICSKNVFSFCLNSLRHAAQAPREGLVVDSSSTANLVVVHPSMHMAERVSANGESGRTHGYQSHLHFVLVVLVMLLLLDQVFFDQACRVDTLNTVIILHDRGDSLLLLITMAFQHLTAFHRFNQLLLKRGSSFIGRGGLLLL